MKDLGGQPYENLENAFRHRREYVANCTCRGNPWDEAALARHRAYAETTEAEKEKAVAAAEKTRNDKQAKRERGVGRSQRWARAVGATVPETRNDWCWGQNAVKDHGKLRACAQGWPALSSPPVSAAHRRSRHRSPAHRPLSNSPSLQWLVYLGERCSDRNPQGCLWPEAGECHRAGEPQRSSSASRRRAGQRCGSCRRRGPRSGSTRATP